MLWCLTIWSSRQFLTFSLRPHNSVTAEGFMKCSNATTQRYFHMLEQTHSPRTCIPDCQSAYYQQDTWSDTRSRRVLMLFHTPQCHNSHYYNISATKSSSTQVTQLNITQAPRFNSRNILELIHVLVKLWRIWRQKLWLLSHCFLLQSSRKAKSEEEICRTLQRSQLSFCANVRFIHLSG